MVEFYEFISRSRDYPLVRDEFRDITEPLERPDATLGDAIDAQLQEYGFSGNTYDLEHEVGHTILGNCFLKMGESPIRLPYPHNGNIFSEPMAEALQRAMTVYINTGDRIPSPTGSELRSELKNYAPGKLASDFNALVSCEDYANRMGKDQTGFEVFREHGYSSKKVFENSNMVQFNAPPPNWSDVFSDQELDTISQLADPVINKILDYFEAAENGLPENSTQRREFFNQVLREIPANVLEVATSAPVSVGLKSNDHRP